MKSAAGAGEALYSSWLGITLRAAIYIALAGVLYQLCLSPHGAQAQQSNYSTYVARDVADLTKRIEAIELNHIDSEHRLTKLEQIADDSKYYMGIILTCVVSLVGEMIVRWFRIASKQHL